MDITVDKNLRTPLYWQITDQIKTMIVAGELVDGSILPSERELSKILGVHRNTIIRAYYTLKDMDLIESARGVGYRVTYGVKDDLNFVQSPRKQVNWSHMIKDEYLDMKETYDDIYARFTEGNSISLSSGVAPAVYMEDDIGDEIAAILNKKGAVPAYLTPYQGDQTLRQQILAYLRTKGIKAGMSQVQILSETNQAIDFIVTAMHLDTVFTMIDYDKFTIHPEIEGPLQLFEITLGKDGRPHFEAITDSLQNCLKKALRIPAVELIRCGGNDLMAAQREQWNDGSNTLCIAPGTVVTYERNYVTNDLLDKKGINVLTIPSAELSRGRGGPRCMSCPVNRDDL